MKTCRICNEEKSYSEFFKNKKMKDGHFNECKTCTNKYRREYERKRSKEKKSVKHKIKAKCPICEKEYTTSDVEYVGSGVYRKICKFCLKSRLILNNGSQQKSEDEITRKERNDFLLSDTRGLSVEENKSRNISLELEGRKLREIYGVHAPITWDRVYDGYHGQYGGI